MAITSVGTGSGLDLEGLLEKIVSAERTPTETRLNDKQTRLEASISALGSLKSTLADFQISLAKLKKAESFSTRSATSSDTKLFTASAASGAELAGYDIGVLKMAKAHKLASGDFASADSVVGTGTLNITAGGSSFDVTIEAGVNDTLAGVRDAINNASGNSGVRASILTVSDGGTGTVSKLVLTANTTGASNAVSVAVSGDGDTNDTDNLGLSRLISANLTETSAAQDAIITIDGFQATSSTNTFANAIAGVTLTVLQEPDDPLTDPPLTGSLTVATDKSGIKGEIETFVANYNAMVTVFNALTDYDRTTETRGLLSGDASISVMERRIRSAMNSIVPEAAEGVNSLAFLGVATNRDGSISLDDTKLSAAVNTRYDDLAALFTGENGIATRLDAMVSDFNGAGGVFSTRNESLQNQLRDIDDQRDKLALRLSKVEARYREQFSALDILVGQLQQTGDFLLQQLDAAAAITNGRNK